jgi:Protein of unknown function (DUF2946)
MEFRQAGVMSLPIRKLIAVLLAVWLPLFGGSAQATSISMQHGSCHEAGMEAMQMAGDHHAAASHSPSHHGSSCNACGVCHLVCGGYLSVQEITASTMHLTDASQTPYLFSFHSITSIPLLPPPLAQA